MKKCRSNKGFTLVELIIVIAILAIIMLIAIPNFSGIQQRMKVRADKSTAAQIGKAMRVWYTDYTTDPVLTAAIKDDENCEDFLEGGNLVDYTLLKEYDSYCSKYEPTSMVDEGVPVKHQKYVVGLTSDSTAARICVGILSGGNAEEASWDTGLTIDSEIDVDYDGTESGIAYIEPGEDAPAASPAG